jgi:hypothetical protein
MIANYNKAGTSKQQHCKEVEEKCHMFASNETEFEIKEDLGNVSDSNEKVRNYFSNNKPVPKSKLIKNSKNQNSKKINLDEDLDLIQNLNDLKMNYGSENMDKSVESKEARKQFSISSLCIFLILIILIYNYEYLFGLATFILKIFYFSLSRLLTLLFLSIEEG